MSNTTHPPAGDAPPAADQGDDHALSGLLNLGCGMDYRQGWHNVDVVEDVDADEYVDLDDRPWPWPDHAFERVDARHVLEHLTNPLEVYRECTRILEPGGTLVVTYPIGHTRFEDPTHHQHWNWHTADLFDGGRDHAHQFDLPLSLQDRSVDWWISQHDPLTRLYVWYRRIWSGPGPWLEQVPGVYGEVTATYRRREPR